MQKKEIKPQKVILNEKRSVVKFFVFTLLTCGIYGNIFNMGLGFDLNKIIGRNDGKKTMNFLVAFGLSFFTMSIVTVIWWYSVTDRIENELARREIDYNFSTTDFWLWGFVCGFFLFGTVVFYAKLFKAMNLIAADYNAKGE